MYPVGSVNSVYSVYSAAYFLFWCQRFWGRRYGYWSASVYCLSLNSNVSSLPYCLSSDTFGSGISFCPFSRVTFHTFRQLDSMNSHVTFSCQNKIKRSLTLFSFLVRNETTWLNEILRSKPSSPLVFIPPRTSYTIHHSSLRYFIPAFSRKVGGRGQLSSQCPLFWQ